MSVVPYTLRVCGLGGVGRGKEEGGRVSANVLEGECECVRLSSIVREHIL